jgi:hypothetical protein
VVDKDFSFVRAANVNGGSRERHTDVIDEETSMDATAMKRNHECLMMIFTMAEYTKK